MAVLRGAGNKLMKRLFRDSDKTLSVSSTTPIPKVRVSVQPQRSVSTMGAAAKRKKTVSCEKQNTICNFHFVLCVSMCFNNSSVRSKV